MKAMALASIAAFVTLNGAVAGERAANDWEIKSLIVGHILKCGGADCRYGADGTYLHNGQSPGRYTISGGSICVKFFDGTGQCDRVVVNDSGYTMISGSGQRLSFLRPDLADQNSGLTGLTPGLRGPSLDRPSLARPTLNNDPLENAPLSGSSLTSLPGSGGAPGGSQPPAGGGSFSPGGAGPGGKAIGGSGAAAPGGGQAIGVQPPSAIVAPGAAALGFGGGKQQVPGAGLVPGLQPRVTPQAGYGAGASGSASTNSSLTSGLPSAAELPGEGAPGAGVTDQATGQPLDPDTARELKALGIPASALAPAAPSPGYGNRPAGAAAGVPRTGTAAGGKVPTGSIYGAVLPNGTVARPLPYGLPPRPYNLPAHPYGLPSSTSEAPGAAESAASPGDASNSLFPGKKKKRDPLKDWGYRAGVSSDPAEPGQGTDSDTTQPAAQ